MPRVRVSREEESLMTNDAFYEESLEENLHQPTLHTTYLENVLGEIIGTLNFVFPLACDVVPYH